MRLWQVYLAEAGVKFKILRQQCAGPCSWGGCLGRRNNIPPANNRAHL